MCESEGIWTEHHTLHLLEFMEDSCLWHWMPSLKKLS